MAKTHFKQLVNPTYLGAYSLEPGKDKILTIKEIKNELIVGAEGRKETCTVVYFAEKEKPAILNVTNMKTIAKIYKSMYVDDWIGKKIQFYATTTRFGGETVECLRIRPFIPKEDEKEAVCADCGGKIEAFGTLTAQQVILTTQRKYGAVLCGACAAKRKEAQEADK